MPRAWRIAELVRVRQCFQAHLVGLDAQEGDTPQARTGAPLVVSAPGPDPEAAVRYMRRTFVDSAHLDEMDEEARALLIELFNQWGTAARRIDDPAAVAVFSRAVACEPPDQTKGRLLYNRGCAQLQQSVRDLQGGDLRATRSARRSSALWVEAIRDLRSAVALGQRDDCTYSSLGLVLLLYAARSHTATVTERIIAARSAQRAYVYCLKVLSRPWEETRSSLEQNLSRAREVEEELLKNQLWWRSIVPVGTMRVSPDVALGPYR